MPTMAEAVKEFLASENRAVSAQEVRQAILSAYPDKWQTSTVNAHLYACAVNNPRAYKHHPYAEKFLYRNSDGTIELFVEAKHGARETWLPDVIDGNDDEELIEGAISLERDIEDHLAKNLGAIEPGLKLTGQQIVTAVGRVDILAEDSKGQRVVIELKVGEAKDASVGQIARYLGWYTKSEGKKPRGILITSEFSEPIRYAADAIADLELFSYKISFKFDRVKTG